MAKITLKGSKTPKSLTVMPAKNYGALKSLRKQKIMLSKYYRNIPEIPTQNKTPEAETLKEQRPVPITNGSAPGFKAFPISVLNTENLVHSAI